MVGDGWLVPANPKWILCFNVDSKNSIFIVGCHSVNFIFIEPNEYKYEWIYVFPSSFCVCEIFVLLLWCLLVILKWKKTEINKKKMIFFLVHFLTFQNPIRIRSNNFQCNTIFIFFLLFFSGCYHSCWWKFSTIIVANIYFFIYL